ncbi:VOC family protein [Tardiphaga sp.]|uniref:VOC family protein n=1 Tax=Tardiphaga sp. TaxID=1926292 RepID=UPI00260EDAA4|nr:VOC family protein [Tardiphaga sp.]MDB5620880.1 hypothetical protein [Tardiphaga sp.]
MELRAVLDHITVAALTLEQGVAHVRDALNVEMPFGGSHPLMGTHNCLMQLGDGVFLEVIAPDPAVTPQRKRWFGLDDPAMRARLEHSPQLITWVARVPDLGRAHDGAAGEVLNVTRGELSWLIAVPRDGSMPFEGAYPTLIEWPAGPHPSVRMADLDCRLERFAISHPDGARLSLALGSIVTDERIVVSTGDTVRLRASIRTPDGLRELG